MSGAKRKKAEKKGRMAEILAAILLSLKGYQIIKYRYKCTRGEIDLIALRGKIIVFIEVKSRKDIEAGILAINASNRKRIADAASHFCVRNEWSNKYSRRYDAVLFTPNRFPKHIRDAFRPNT